MSQSSKKTTLEARTGEKLVRNRTLYRGAVCPMKSYLFFLNINTNHRFRFCHRSWVSVLPLEIKGARRTPAMAPSSGYVSLLSWCGTFGYLPRPTWWESRVPMPVKTMAVIMFAMIVCTLIIITMIRGGARNAANHFTQAEMDNIAQLSRETQAMKEHDSFLRNDEPSLERKCNHRRACSVFQNGDCSCKRGAYSIAEVQDLENQLLQTGDARGPTTYRIIKPATSMGPDNFRRVFASNTASSRRRHVSGLRGSWGISRNQQSIRRARRARGKEIQVKHSAGTVTRKDIKWKIQKMALKKSAKI